MNTSMNWAAIWRASAIGLALAMTPGLTQEARAQTAAERVPVPLDAMVRESFLSNVVLSPDGEHLAAISSLDGEERAISIWRTNALDQNPVRFGVGGAAARSRVRFAGIEWVANDRILVLLQQPVTLGSGAENRSYTALARIVNLDGSQWIEPLAQGGTRSDLEDFADKFLSVDLIDTLPRDPRHVLVSKNTLDATFIYRVDVYSGRGERVAQLGEDEGVVPVVDREGNIRVKQFARYRDGAWVIGHEVFDPASRRWDEHPLLGYSASARRNINVLAIDPTDPDLLIVLDDEGQNFTYARSYSISRRAFVETLFQHARYDVTGVLMDRADQDPTRIVGFTYAAASETPYYTDPAYRALYEGLQAQLPGRNLYIGARNGAFRLIVTESSRHPPAYFLLENDQRLIALGSSVSGVPSNQLAPTELVYYQARDGLSIPAFLTLPYGFRRGVDAPLPVIIQPHGGPWGRNDATWGGGDIPVTQYFASRGFAVLQPQFRGSTGFGNQLWRAGDRQWGMSMQDDKDDGLRWLVDQGVADPARAVIYGFSYGGFAAMAATVRPNSPYRCAISGAGVSSLQRLGTLWSQNRVQRDLQGTTVTGMDPLAHASEANIPILIYHGDRDQTATLWHSERFDAALRGAGKPHEFVVIPDMPHGAITPAMRRREFELVENFIRGTCGISY
jgi:dipeptidyl aminopeptidase/acylaminoacyl peptidase